MFLQILGYVETLGPRVLSFIVSDLKAKKLSRFKRKTFEDIMRTSGNPWRYFCHCSYAAWDIQLPSKKKTQKQAEKCIVTKFFWQQLGYMGSQRIKVTICNVPIQLPSHILTSFLSKCGRVRKYYHCRVALALFTGITPSFASRERSSPKFPTS